MAPELGTLEDFAWLVGEIKKRGMEIALDFAINCSPDHPYVRDHPEWFFKRPDGTIKYAENPPKEVSGRLSAQLPQSELGGIMEGVARRDCLLVRSRRANFPRG